MIPGYPYTSMMVTGILHCLLGVASVITSSIGLSTGYNLSIYFIVTLLIGLYFCLVGCLGIAAGVNSLEDNRTRQLKIAYMVIAILSACIFSLVAGGLYGTVVAFSRRSIYQYMNYFKIATAGIAIAFLEFILAIVSSSICCCSCCCSSTIPNTTMIVQTPPQEINTTVPGNTTIQYQYPPNYTMQYTATGDGAVSYQPATYPQDPYLTKQQCQIPYVYRGI